MDARKTDVLVIGGGVIGLACAHALLKRGRSVKVVEKGEIGSGASWGNCGIISVSHAIPLCAPGVIGKALKMMLQRDAPLSLRPGWNLEGLSWLIRFAAKCRPDHAHRAMKARADLLALSRSLFDQLFASHDMACDWETRGALFLCRSSRVQDEVAHTQELLAQLGLQGRALDSRGLQSLEPSLRPDLAGGWSYSAHAHLRPDRLVQEWARVVAEAGGEIVTQCEVQGFDTGSAGMTWVQTSRGGCAARDVVLAAGAWSGVLAGKLGLHLPVRPARGISLTMDPQGASSGLPCFLVDASTVATPWKSGFRLGGRLELTGFDTTVRDRHLQLLKKAYQEYFQTGLSPGPEEGWAGLRPMTCDDLPVLGRTGRYPNLYMATGHNMLGLTMAPGTGEVLADLVTGQAPCLDISCFDPDRFDAGR